MIKQEIKSNNEKNARLLLNNPFIAAISFRANDNWNEIVTISGLEEVMWFADGINERTKFISFKKSEIRKRYCVSLSEEINNANTIMNKLPTQLYDKEDAEVFNRYSWFLNIFNHDIKGTYMYKCNVKTGIYELCIVILKTNSHGTSVGHDEVYVYHIDADNVINNKNIINKKYRPLYINNNEDFYKAFNVAMDTDILAYLTPMKDDYEVRILGEVVKVYDTEEEANDYIEALNKECLESLKDITIEETKALKKKLHLKNNKINI